MSIPYVVDGETDLDSLLFNPIIDRVNGDAGPLANMRVGTINVLDVLGTGGTIQDAVTAGAGGRVDFPYRAGGYSISAGLTVAAGTTIVLAPGVVIEQTTKYKPVFDVLDADDVTITGGTLRWTGSRTYTGGGNFRGGDDYLYGSGVWSNSDRTTVEDVRVEGFTCGVFLSPWNGTTTQDSQAQGSRIRNVTVDDVDFGVLSSGHDNVTIGGIRGSYSLQSTSTNPSHLVYISNLKKTKNLTIEPCKAWDGTGGHAYSIRGVRGGTVNGLSADNCTGVLSFIDNADVTVDGVSSANDQGGDTNGSLYMTSPEPTRCTISNVALDMVVSLRAVRLLGTDCLFFNHQIRTRHDTTFADYAVVLSGTRNLLDGVSILNLQDDGSDYDIIARGINVTSNADACTVRPATLRNHQLGITVTSGCTDTILDLSAMQCTLGTTVGVRQVDDAGTRTRIRFPKASRSVSSGVTLGQLDETALVDASGGACTIVLPAAQYIPGKTYTVKKLDASNNVVVDGNSSETIDGTTTKTITTQYGFLTVLSDGTGWQIVASGGTIT